MTRRVGFALVVVAMLTALSVTVYLLWREQLLPYPRGVLVTVRNVDSAVTLKSLTVVVTGAEYDLGDLAPGEAKTVRVNPRGESGIVLRHVRQPGTSELQVGCYIETNYSGSLEVDVTSDKVVRVADKIRI